MTSQTDWSVSWTPLALEDQIQAPAKTHTISYCNFWRIVMGGPYEGTGLQCFFNKVAIQLA